MTSTYNNDGSLNTSTTTALTDTINSITSLATDKINTYVIGLGAGVNSTANLEAAKVLKAMAVAGKTNDFFPANDPSSLTAAFNSIAQDIYNQTSVSAPVAPISVKSGGLEYQLISNPSPVAGYVTAFSVQSNGTASTTAQWDASSLMSGASRTSALMSTDSTGSVMALASVDVAAFNVPGTACAPNKAAIISFVNDPSYNGISGCDYKGGRAAGTFLSTFSTQDSAKYMGPPSNALLVEKSGYASYAISQASRTKQLVFTNNDGFLYAIDAATGALNWGWTPRSVLGQMQAYATFQSKRLMDGSFTVVDAANASSVWGSYIVGSAQSGAEHYILQLDSTGKPTTVVYDSVIAGGVAPGDQASTTGAAPYRQPPQLLYIGSQAYMVYVVNFGTLSTIYEVNVATGVVTASVLPFTSSATLSVDQQSNTLWLGSTTGALYRMPVTSVAATDAVNLTQIATMTDPTDTSNTTTVKPVLYVGYSESKGIPYVYAVSKNQLTLYSINRNGWVPIFAATPTSGYAYSGSNYTANTTLAKWTIGSVASDLPRIDGTTLLLPVFVTGATSCDLGTGYYDFFDITSGKFPTVPYKLDGLPITQNLLIGSGPAFTPSITLIQTGLALNTGSSGNLTPKKPLVNNGLGIVRPITWKQF